MGGTSSITVQNTTIDLNEYKCSDRGLILPFISEYTWPLWIRGLIYLFGLLYLFLGTAIIADVFMSAIEKITSKTKVIRFPNPDPKSPKKFIEKEIKLWNETVANLTLMALGSSSPEILLSVIEICGNNFLAGELGPGTIVGSAAYNLLCITAICVIAIEANEVKRIKNFKVFLTTTVYSLFAYIWLFLILVVITPNEITLWEAVVTFLCFPVLVVNSYIAEKNFFLGSTETSDEEETKPFTSLSVWERKKIAQNQDVSPEDVIEMSKKLKRKDLSEEEKAKLMAASLLEAKEKSRMFYRMNGVREMIGARKSKIELSDKLKQVLDEEEGEGRYYDHQDDPGSRHSVDLSEDNTMAVLEFAATSYAVLENELYCRITIKRYGNLDNPVSFRVETLDGTAKAGEDYDRMNEIRTMEAGQTQMPLDVVIIDDNQWEPDEVFFVKLSLHGDQESAKLGHKDFCMVTIIDDDEPGMVEFNQPIYVVKESIGKFKVEIERKNGADGEVSIAYKTADLNAIAGKDYVALDGVLEFKHGETKKSIDIEILDDKCDEKDESFSIEIYDPKGGVKIGKITKTVVTIINDGDLQIIANRMANLVNANLEALGVEKKGYKEQFFHAMNVNGGDFENATKMDHIMHFFSFPWKVIFAFMPPPHIWGGWLCFWCSLAVIGILTAIVGDAAAIFGCLVGLKDSVTAITFVALGTSLPDTFASKIAAKNERTADNAIGNVTGSNSVNVFLGLGLPWVIATIYWQAKGLPFTVYAGSLTFSVAVFTIVSIICFSVLFLRRYLPVFGGGELGGPTIPKYLTAGLFVFLWMIYILLSSLQAYGIINI